MREFGPIKNLAGRMRFAAIFLVVLAIAVIDTVTAEDKSVPDGTIYGHVYDADTKQPLSQAFVYCQEIKCSKPATNSMGYYATDPCFSPSQTYTIQCTRHGYQTATKSVTTDQSGNAVADFNLVSEGSTPGKKPESDFAIKGMVKDGNGAGLAGWKINLATSFNEMIANTTTSGDGSYFFSNMLPGNYLVSDVLPAGWSALSPTDGKASIALLDKDITVEFVNTVNAAVPAPLPKPESVEVNKPPAVNSLEPDKPSPQFAGAVITWTSQAYDPENDPLVFRFSLKGPATGDQWKEMTGWLSDNKWTWATTDNDVGENQIEVQLRDLIHSVRMATIPKWRYITLP